MSGVLLLDLGVLFPELPDGDDPCALRLSGALQDLVGVELVDLVPDEQNGLQMRVHFDPGTTKRAELRRYAESFVSELTEQIGHVIWHFEPIRRARKLRELTRGLLFVAGVLHVEVRSGSVRIEYDRSCVTEERLDAVLAQHKVAVLSDGRRA